MMSDAVSWVDARGVLHAQWVDARGYAISPYVIKDSDLQSLTIGEISELVKNKKIRFDKDMEYIRIHEDNLSKIRVLIDKMGGIHE